MKKIIMFFLVNIVVAYGAIESNVFGKVNFGNDLDFLVGLLAFSILGLFSLELYKNRKIQI